MYVIQYSSINLYVNNYTIPHDIKRYCPVTNKTLIDP